VRAQNWTALVGTVGGTRITAGAKGTATGGWTIGLADAPDVARSAAAGWIAEQVGGAERGTFVRATVATGVTAAEQVAFRMRFAPRAALILRAHDGAAFVGAAGTARVAAAQQVALRLALRGAQVLGTHDVVAFVGAAGAARARTAADIARAAATLRPAQGVARIANRVAERARARGFADAHAAAAIAVAERIACAATVAAAGHCPVYRLIRFTRRHALRKGR